ncbi:MAG: DUF721 domain-containing protein [Gammaproteobacteria bacterium]
MNSPALLGRIVTRLSQLKQLTAQAERLATLNRLYGRDLPPQLRAHCRLAAVRDGCLLVHADSAAWATQLRYRAPELVASLPDEPEFAGVRTLRVQTRAPDYMPAPVVARARMSGAAAAAMVAQAEHIGDARLRAALQRLARRGGRAGEPR